MAKAKAGERKGVEVAVVEGDLTRGPAELVVVEAFEGVEAFSGVTKAVDEATGGALARIVAAGDFKGKFKESVMVHPASGGIKRVLLVGMGPLDKLTLDKVRRVSAVIARRARDLGVVELRSVLLGVRRAPHAKQPRAKQPRPAQAAPPSLAARDVAQAMAEGALLGLYKFDAYKGAKKPEEAKKALARIVLVEKRGAVVREAEAGAREGAIIAEATNLCRDWSSWSGDDAAPGLYGERVLALGRAHGLKAVVLEKAEIEKLGMGGLLAVARGSVREPRFCVLEHAPKGAKHTLVLVGKGITFDSGGISIKPAEGMESMKMDKSGASAVVAAVVAAKRLGLPLRVIALAPFTDNLPSGSAYKPGDVVRTMSGKTIEIVNTDAEGRVILSDALHYAARYKPDAVVELSTLTGGAVIAVGHLAIAAMGNSDELFADLRAAGEATHERIWPLPFFEEYGEMVKSQVADVKNSAGRIASSVTAGKFLETFVDGQYPWAHLDIASTAWHEGASPRFNDEYCPEKSTGVGVRLLVRWMRDFQAPPWKR